MDAALTRVSELVTDSRDGRLSMTKIGSIIAGSVFTVKMVTAMPNDVELWITYIGALSGQHLLAKYISARAGGTDAGPAA